MHVIHTIIRYYYHLLICLIRATRAALPRKSYVGSPDEVDCDKHLSILLCYFNLLAHSVMTLLHTPKGSIPALGALVQ